MSYSDAPIDPRITKAPVMYGKVAEKGSRVKHWGQRFTGHATATVVGFYHETGEGLKVRVKPDKPDGYGNTWDSDRTELVPDIGQPVS